MALHAYDAVLTGQNLLGVGNLVESQLLCHLGANLCRVAVDGLSAADDKIYVGLHMLDGSGQSVAGGQGVGTCEGAVGKQVTAVCTAIHSLANHFSGTSGAHGHYSHRGSGVLVFQSESLLQCIQVLGIEYCRQGATVYGAFGGHGIWSHVARVGYLLSKHYNLETHISILYEVCITIAHLCLNRAKVRISPDMTKVCAGN